MATSGIPATTVVAPTAANAAQLALNIITPLIQANLNSPVPDTKLRHDILTAIQLLCMAVLGTPPPAVVVDAGLQTVANAATALPSTKTR